MNRIGNRGCFRGGDSFLFLRLDRKVCEDYQIVTSRLNWYWGVWTELTFLKLLPSLGGLEQLRFSRFSFLPGDGRVIFDR